MSVTQRLMKPGTWNLRFKAKCPRSIYSAPDFFDHIVITPTKMEPIAGFSDADILAKAIYTGVIHTKPDHLSLEGAGLEWWLGAPGGNAFFLSQMGPYGSAKTLSDIWADPNAIFGSTNCLTAGTANNSGLSSYSDFTIPFGTSGRERLDAVSQLYGSEWRVNPTGTVDGALTANLFVTTPTVTVTRYNEGQEGGYRGLFGTNLNAASDMQDFATMVRLSYGGARTNSAPFLSGYYDFNGNDLERQRLIDGGTITAAQATSLVTAAGAKFGAVRRNLTLSSDTYSVGRFVQPGDYVYVWDQEAGLSDAANQIPYRGELISPIKLRVYALTWPLASGMGVYLRENTAGTVTYTDLSDYIEWETGEVSWEVGGSDRDITDTGTYGTPAYLGRNAAFVESTAATLGVLGVHSLTTAFSTAATHTTFQDEGLTKTVGDIAGRRYKFSLVVNPLVPGGANGVGYRLLRDGTQIRDWDIPTDALSTGFSHGMTLTHSEVIAATHAAAVYKLQMRGHSNLQVQSYAAATYPRQLIIEDIGHV